jgi:8-oxo-dGTP diphosphatase
MKLRNMASMIIIDGGKILLLHKQPKFSDRSLWLAGAGGHFEHTEMNDPDACLWREVEEEIGLKPDAFESVSLRYMSVWKSGDEILINYSYVGILRDDVSRDLTNNEGELRWFDLDDACDLGSLCGMTDVFVHYRDIGQGDDGVYVIAYSMNYDGEKECKISPLLTY